MRTDVPWPDAHWRNPKPDPPRKPRRRKKMLLVQHRQPIPKRRF